MRTTLTIQPDVERLLQREMRRTGRSMKAVLPDRPLKRGNAAGRPRDAGNGRPVAAAS